MGIVKIDVIGLQTVQRIVTGSNDVFRGQTRTAIEFGDLGRDHNRVSVPTFLLPIADDALRLSTRMPLDPLGIHICGIDKIPSIADEMIEHLFRVVHIG